MNNRDDAFLLYEYMSKVPFTVRAKVRLSEDADPKLLDEAAQEAVTRLPYFSVKIGIDDENNYVIQHNDAPIPVRQEQNKRLVLGSAELGRHLFAITYYKDLVWFSFSHSICGGNGAMTWIKTTLYLYLTKKYGRLDAPKNIRLPGTPITEQELAMPDPDQLPDDEPLMRYDGGNSNIALPRMLKFLLNPAAKDNYYYQLIIPSKAFMDYARSIDGSPNTVIAAMLFKSLAPYFKEKEGSHFSVGVAADYRSDIGADESYRDFVRLLHVRYDWSMKNESVEKLNMRARGAIIGQSQPELSYERYKHISKVHKGIIAQPTLKEKKKYAGINSVFRNNIRDTCNLSYAKPEDWGGMSPYIKEIYILTDGDIMLEVTALKDVFCISFQLMNKDSTPFDLFCRLLETEKLPFKATKIKTRLLPKIEFPKK